MGTEADEWRWTVDSRVCTECGWGAWCDDVFVYKGERMLCLDCAVMVLNAREDYIEDLQAKCVWREISHDGYSRTFLTGCARSVCFELGDGFCVDPELPKFCSHCGAEIQETSDVEVAKKA